MAVIGSDARPGENVASSRGDAIHILGIDGNGGGGLLGMARDIWAPMPGGGSAKLNAALARAARRGWSKPSARSPACRSRGSRDRLRGFTRDDRQSGADPHPDPDAGDRDGQRHRRRPQPLRRCRAALDYARLRHDLPDGDFGVAPPGELVPRRSAIKARMAGIGSVPAALSIASRHVDPTSPPRRL